MENLIKIYLRKKKQLSPFSYTIKITAPYITFATYNAVIIVE